MNAGDLYCFSFARQFLFLSRGSPICSALFSKLYILYSDTNKQLNASYFKFPHGNYSYARESPTLPPNDDEAARCLHVTVFIGPDIHYLDQVVYLSVALTKKTRIPATQDYKDGTLHIHVETLFGNRNKIIKGENVRSK
jgi:hypothetical protein